MKDSQSGFVALLSVLILSSVLLVTTLELAQFGIANRFFILSLEQKTMSEQQTNACLELVQIKIYNDPTYDVSNVTPYTIAGHTCSIVSAHASGNNTTVRIQAAVGDAVTNLEASVNNQTGSLTKVVALPAL